LRLSVFNVANQRVVLEQLRELTLRSTVHPLVTTAARQITALCESRDDECELEAVYEAVKSGTDRVPELRRGLRYVADPHWADHFTAPYRLLMQCQKGACAGDCDDHSMLVAALLGSIGFRTGLRAWGPKKGEYIHVYAVAKTPKKRSSEVVGLDTTVPEAYVGWEPPHGYTLTAWLDGDEDDE